MLLTFFPLKREGRLIRRFTALVHTPSSATPCIDKNVDVPYLPHWIITEPSIYLPKQNDEYPHPLDMVL